MYVCVCVCVCAYVCLSSSVCPAAGVMRGRSGTGTSCWVSRHGMTTLALWPGQNSQKHMIQYEDTHSHTHTQIISCSPHSRSGELILKQQHVTFLTKTEKDWQPVRPTQSAGIWHPGDETQSAIFIQKYIRAKTHCFDHTAIWVYKLPDIHL